MHSLVLVGTVGCALFGLFQAAVGPADQGWCKVPFPEQGSLIQLDFGGPRLKLWSHRSTVSTRKPSFSTRTTLFKSRAFRLFGFSSRSSVFSLPPTSPCGEARMAAFCGGGGAGGSGAWAGRVWCWHRRGGAGQVRSARGRWCRGGGRQFFCRVYILQIFARKRRLVRSRQRLLHFSRDVIFAQGRNGQHPIFASPCGSKPNLFLTIV